MANNKAFIQGFKQCNDSLLKQYGVISEYWDHDDILEQMQNMGFPFDRATEAAMNSILDLLKRNYSKDVGINRAVIRIAILTYCDSNNIELEPRN
jgi:hypothetical protein